MIITSAQYQRDPISQNDNSIKAVVDGAEILVPLSASNRHYNAIMKWSEIEGNNIVASD